MLIGGMAVIARGVGRETIDVDATVHLGEHPIETLLEPLKVESIRMRRDDGLDFARRNQILLLRHEPSGTEIDLSFAWLPFELEALERAEAIDFAGVTFLTATAEDLIIYKAVAWRDQDRKDLDRLLLLHGGEVQLERVRSWVRRYAEVLDAPERITEFEDLLSRARR